MRVTAHIFRATIGDAFIHFATHCYHHTVYGLVDGSDRLVRFDSELKKYDTNDEHTIRRTRIVIVRRRVPVEGRGGQP